MRFKDFLDSYKGLFLVIAGTVVTIWLGATKQLNLYIHPRYLTFTVGVALISLLLAVASFRLRPQPEEVRTSKVQQSLAYGTVLFCMIMVLAMVGLKPATLTTTTANQRSINSGISGGAQTTNAVPLFDTGNYRELGVKEWASLLTQTSQVAFYTNKSAHITGFVAPDPDDPQNVFFVSRFIIACCAVDARPIGVPVYMPNWQATHKPDSWVEAEGGFATNPSTSSKQRIIVRPTKVTPIAQPKDPYVY
jgi:putative membrane protein